MNSLDHKKHWESFLDQLSNKNPLTDEQFKHLEKVFKKILSGEDANKALGIKPKRGSSHNDALARTNISLVLWWVANATAPRDEEEITNNVKRMTLNEAFIKAEEHFQIFGYSAETIQKYWYSADKKHMQDVIRKYDDPDSPIYK